LLHAIPTPEPTPLPPVGPGNRVLVVDDNDDVRFFTAELLQGWGHAVEQAASGIEAVERAIARPPEVILLDLGMPGLDGYDTAALLRQRLGDATPPIVAVSGFGSPRDRERTSAASFAAHLLKPVDPDQLLATLAAVLTPPET
ncbi:MAG: response regulator, partial [Myxococcota bacterium]